MTGPAYERAQDLAAAVSRCAASGTMLMAGGTEVVAWLADGIVAPDRLVDLSEAGLDRIARDAGWLRIGAAATLASIERHPDVADAPALAEAVAQAASPAIRAHGTLAGNLLQQTRCPYFRGHGACNRRQAGAGCAARVGEHRGGALFGATEACVAVHPSDPAVALAGLDAEVLVAGTDVEEWRPLDRLYHPDPVRPHALSPHEVIAAVRVPLDALAASGRYRKVRDQAAFGFALVSAATHVVHRDGPASRLTIALGGVAARPWRCRIAEALLQGRALSESAIRTALEAEFAGAAPLPQNAFKMELAIRLVVSGLLAAEPGP